MLASSVTRKTHQNRKEMPSHSPTQMVVTSNINKQKWEITCQGGCGETGSLTRCWEECKMVQPSWQRAAVRQKVKRSVTITSHVHTQRARRRRAHRCAAGPRRRSRRLATAQRWKGPKCPSTGECTRQTAIGARRKTRKRKEILTPATDRWTQKHTE